MSYDAGALHSDAKAFKGELFRMLAPAVAAAAGAAVGGGGPSTLGALTSGAMDGGSRRESQPSPVRPLPRGNLLGAGYGAKMTDGNLGSDDLVVRVYVRSKYPKSQLARGEVVPSQVNGCDTDVVVVGDISAASCGTSCGHFAVDAGTAGCLVEAQGKTYILSNNHILANANDAKEGDPIYQPGPLDGGTEQDAVAKLADFESLDFGAAAGNSIDAAIAELLPGAQITRQIRTIGTVTAPEMTASVYQSVRKHGRTTNHKVGVVVDVAADLWVQYGSQRAWFEDQLAVVGLANDPLGFGQRGDSGSLVVDAVSKRPVGLLFAVGGSQTFVNPIGPILHRFSARIL